MAGRGNGDDDAGPGRTEREYGLGQGRTCLLAPWPREPGQPPEVWERFVVGCKVPRDSDRKSLTGTVERVPLPLCREALALQGAGDAGRGRVERPRHGPARGRDGAR